MDLFKDKTAMLFMAVAAAFLGLAIIGGLRAYSPVPFWDMWDAYLDFFFKAGAGHWDAWWEQQNEHRLVLSKIFFWMDLAWFHGSVWFLLVINYLLVGLICLMFWLFAQEQTEKPWRFIWFFLIAWLFSWSQKENFTCGFQNQFFLAQLLPLTAFYFLHRSASHKTRANGYFGVAVIFGVMSIGTMANGVLALSLMTLYAILVRLGWRKCLVLAVMSFVTLGAYFYNYQTVTGHGSVLLTLRQNPLGMIQFMLLYLGGPFGYLFGMDHHAKFVLQLAGLWLILGSLVFAWRALRDPRESTLPLALLTFLLYLGSTALGTAGGRLLFGLDTALSSRYMTPALMAWAVLLILSMPSLARVSNRTDWKLWGPFLLVLVLLLPNQLKALESQRQNLFEKKCCGSRHGIGHQGSNAD